MSDTRIALSHASTVVVKVGSSSLTTAKGGLDHDRLAALVDAISARRLGGAQVVLVSSGAIAAGLAPLGISRRPKDLALQQAAASVGQLSLAHAYAESFGRHSLVVGQVLLTANDIVRRSHYRNAQRTMASLLSMGVVPVVNENDTVATDEIRFGDNDRLAALVAHLVGADALILLSDVDAVYDRDPADPNAQLIDEIGDSLAAQAIQVDSVGSSGVGTGGMASKLAAATLAAGAGIPALIASAHDAMRALSAADVGTAFTARRARLSARRFWLAHAADSVGALVLDDGAVAAVRERRRSLLAAGIVAAVGDFRAGDVVELRDGNQHAVARGVVAFDADELPSMIGKSTPQLPVEKRREVVHADDLVAL